MEQYDEQAVRFWNSLRPRPVSRNEEILSGLRENPQNRDLWAIVNVGSAPGDSLVSSVYHMLGSKWGDGSPWNSKMPTDNNNNKCKVGSPAVAVSQVLYYFSTVSSLPKGLYHQISIASSTPYPGGGQTIFLSRSDFTNNSPRWSQMPYAYGYGTTTQYEYASELMLDIGERLGTVYNTSYSYVPFPQGGSLYLSPAKLSYSTASYDYSLISTVVNDLSTGKPVIMSAQSSTGGQHVWVIDGYVHKKVFTQTNYELWPTSMLYLLDENATIVDIMGESQLALIYPNYYPGMTFYTREDYSDSYEYWMNWGEDGNHYYDLYSAYSPSDDGFNIDKRIYYDLVPGELTVN